MIRQQLQQKLQQKLSPQQIQLMKLLQVPIVQLEQRIKQEIEENPALEEIENEQNEEHLLTDDSDSPIESDDEIDFDETSDSNDLAERDDDFNYDEYFDDDSADYDLYQPNNHDNEPKSMPYVSGNTFRDLLFTQLGLRDISAIEYLIGEQIIGNIDDAGYLQRDLQAIADDLAFYQNIHVSTQEIEKVIQIVQDFDPPGVGARNLKECLLIQLNRLPETDDYKTISITIIQKFFEEFTKKHYDKIIQKTGITEKQLSDTISYIQQLNPKPANSSSESVQTTFYVVPDFVVENNNDILELTLTKSNIPELKISRTYIDMLYEFSKYGEKMTEQQKQTAQFVKQKIDSAKWFIDAITQRHNTLYVTMKSIMDFQKEYFLTGDETKIKPMILKDIADIVELDISTVSRVANSKYVQTSYGTFLLKTFFSESLSTDSGEEVSSREVKKILENCIESENKRIPLTDEQLAKILNDKGYNIARRTIAKYRDILGIPVARLRKEL